MSFRKYASQIQSIRCYAKAQGLGLFARLKSVTAESVAGDLARLLAGS